MPEPLLAAAQETDAPAIRRMIWSEGLNPISLNWRRFVVARDDTGQVVGCIQVKLHGDGTRELASLVVQAEWRRQGLATRLIQTILKDETGALYLTCRESLQTFYKRFGFHILNPSELPPYFRRLRTAFVIYRRLARLPEDIAVMRREANFPENL
jgi:N-acetylglutamate synthase-like GNAT family acetyltransferase